jgi:hypothetical protein
MQLYKFKNQDISSTGWVTISLILIRFLGLREHKNTTSYHINNITYYDNRNYSKQR